MGNCLRLQCVDNNERTIEAEVKFNMEIYCKHICIFCERIFGSDQLDTWRMVSSFRFFEGLRPKSSEL